MVSQALHDTTPGFFCSPISCHFLMIYVSGTPKYFELLLHTMMLLFIHTFLQPPPHLPPFCLVNSYYLKLTSSAISEKSVLTVWMIKCSYLTHPKTLYIYHKLITFF